VRPETIAEAILPFVESIRQGETEIYNEFSLQHELGIFLRTQLHGTKVRFEKNVASLFGRTAGFTKREIDITIFSGDKPTPTHAIELKYPRNGQHPEQMFSFCKDIAFAEELVGAGCEHAAVIIFADDPLFYRGPSNGIYGFFRAMTPLTGVVQKPTGAKDASVRLRGSYTVQWQPILGTLAYTIVEISS
jgi:hypothetical protein